MIDLSILRETIREVVTFQRTARVPEPMLVMENPEHVAQYVRFAENADGSMAPVYFFNCAHICDILRSGDTAVDLACGPAVQLAMVARYNPHVRFLGVDLSEDMLRHARAHVAAQGVKNVELRKGDITVLDFLPDGSVDAVFSTYSLHHLPTLRHLEWTFAEIGRVLKREGGLYLMDFGHLKSEKAIHFFAHRRSDEQKELFTRDYHNSLKAAFYFDDFRRVASEYLGQRVCVYRWFPMPLMIAVKSPSRGGVGSELKKRLKEESAALGPLDRADLETIIRMFRLGGMPTPLLD